MVQLANDLGNHPWNLFWFNLLDLIGFLLSKFLNCLASSKFITLRIKNYSRNLFHKVFYKLKAKVSYRLILEVTLVLFLCPSKNDVAFKIITWLKFNSDQSQASLF
jgi:hypothetical protein